MLSTIIEYREWNHFVIDVHLMREHDETLQFLAHFLA